ncbi:hypothetical protein BpHYR1_000720 [Brachionus plicatilis]|uniref:Uncharacterized protein n=1 Tax=Brachionus plicatilis TaxID=10195 RepID=A0A3M7SCB1_BRAPC|nr:hypothetical protein BpHYR1_000720 [Brachionus plicatilis]
MSWIKYNLLQLIKLMNSFVIKRSMLNLAAFKLTIYNNINLVLIDSEKKFKIDYDKDSRLQINLENYKKNLELLF